MIYTWKCKYCGFRCDVERPVKDYNKPPYDGEESDNMTFVDLEPPTKDIYCTHLMFYDEEITGNHEPQWEKVLYSPNVPFNQLRDSGVFMDEHGNYPPRKVD